MIAAQTDYAARQAAIKGLMAQLTREMKDHATRAAKDPRNWGYAGDLGRVEMLMQELVDGLAGRT